MRHIITFSGGITSAYVAKIVLEAVPDAEIVFSDTRWEHPDLYRFMDDFESFIGKKIIHLSDGRNPEDLFYDIRLLGNNRVPVCSRVLKAEQLQKYVSAGDIVYFGIEQNESHRAQRISAIYDTFGVTCVFPLLSQTISKTEIMQTVESWGIEIPQMYKDGFTHNNCSGGCVRAGVRQWRHLLEKYPDVYAERERVETEFSDFIGKPVTFMKTLSLQQLREQGIQDTLFKENDYDAPECIGVCNTD